MKLSDRDKRLALVLPAIVVLAVYGVFFARSKLTECSRAAKTLAETRAKAPRPEELAAQQRLLLMATGETNRAQANLDDVQRRWLYALAFCGAGSQRNARIERLTSLLNSHDLRPLEDAEVDAGVKDTKLTACAESLAKTITQLAPAQKPQLRRIRFHGRYGDVLHALEELTQGETLAIPVGLTMKTTSDPERRDWVLLVWI
jgi:hypothetical protein